MTARLQNTNGFRMDLVELTWRYGIALRAPVGTAWPRLELAVRIFRAVILVDRSSCKEFKTLEHIALHFIEFHGWVA